MEMDPQSMQQIITGLIPAEIKGYLGLHPKGTQTLRALGGKEEVLDSSILYKMLSDRGMGTMVYKGEIPPSKISILDGSIDEPSNIMGIFDRDFPKAYKEENLLQRTLRGLMSQSLREGELPWWLK